MGEIIQLSENNNLKVVGDSGSQRHAIKLGALVQAVVRAPEFMQMLMGTDGAVNMSIGSGIENGKINVKVAVSDLDEEVYKDKLFSEEGMSDEEKNEAWEAYLEGKDNPEAWKVVPMKRADLALADGTMEGIPEVGSIMTYAKAYVTNPEEEEQGQYTLVPLDVEATKEEEGDDFSAHKASELGNKVLVQGIAWELTDNANTILAQVKSLATDEEMYLYVKELA